MAPSPPRTRAELLAAQIQERIAASGLTVGDHVGNIEGLREETGYARSTVSEAVRLLADRGSIEIRPGRGGGLFVAAHHALVRLRHTLLTVADDATPVEDAIAVRDALEMVVDTDAAGHCTAAHARELRGALARLHRGRRDPQAFIQANFALHEAIAAITPNRILQAVYLTTTRYIADAATQVSGDLTRPEYADERYAVHADLVAAIVAGDVAATRRAVVAHAGESPTPA